MKKIGNLLVPLFFLLFFFHFKANSVPISCRTDCYDTIPYVHDVMFVPIPGCPECTVRVDFLYRYGICDSHEVKDLYVVGFEYDAGFCPCLKNKSDWERWDSVLVHFVKRFYWTDSDEDQIDSVTLKYPPCAKTKGVRIGGGKIRYGEFCYEDTACCIHVLKLVRMWENNDTTKPRKPNYIQSDVVVLNNNDICPVDTIVNGDTIRCTNICNKIVETDPWPPGTPIYLTKNDFSTFENFKGSFYVTTNELILPLNLKPTPHSVHIKIYSTIGDLVFKETKILSENAQASLQLGSLNNGVYYLLIEDSQNPFEYEIVKVLILK